MLALAAARCARAISVDEISEPLRSRLSARADRSPVGHWLRGVDTLMHCPLCVGWWTSLAISFAAPGRQRLIRGMAVAGVQVLLALTERLVSEEGRMAIHVANDAERADTPADDPRPPRPPVAIVTPEPAVHQIART